MNIDELNQSIGKFLLKLGCKPDNLGYYYLKEGLTQFIYNSANIAYARAALYNDVAERFYALPVAVEHHIKKFIDNSWKCLLRAGVIILNLTCEEFISKCAELYIDSNKSNSYNDSQKHFA